MKTLLLILSLSATSLFPVHANADSIYRIEIGHDFKSYTNADLQRRVWELERAVAQLQSRIFQLEDKPAAQPDTWSCTVTAMGEPYVATGPSKAIASANAVDKCKKGGKDGFFCKNPVCEQ